MQLQGGQLPYVAVMWVYLNDKMVQEVKKHVTGKDTISYMPTKAGKYTVQLTVSDCKGDSFKYNAKVPVSPAPRKEQPHHWEETVAGVKLTGSYAHDLVAVAESQLGYTADPAFIVDQSGTHNYTRYGEWYGAPYAEWCVMFISFCAHYAGVPESVLPQEGSSSALMGDMESAGAYRAADSDYVPQKGDIIFMDYTGTGKPTHAGIVTGSSGDTVKTIEGNTSKGVARKSYSLSDPVLIGYGSLAAMGD